MLYKILYIITECLIIKYYSIKYYAVSVVVLSTVIRVGGLLSF